MRSVIGIWSFWWVFVVWIRFRGWVIGGFGCVWRWFVVRVIVWFVIVIWFFVVVWWLIIIMLWWCVY